IELASYVLVSFPESAQDLFELPTGIYNSCALINPLGMVEHIHRKHFLFEAEEHWASCGPEFSHVDIRDFGRVGIGICMDLNFNTRIAESYGKYEFAAYHASSKTRLILVPMNWLKDLNIDESLPSLMTLLYWIARFRPLIEGLTPGQKVYFVTCNRIGTERGTTFTGSSCVLEFSCDRFDQGQNKLHALIDKTLSTISQSLGIKNEGFNEQTSTQIISTLMEVDDLLDKVRLVDSLPTSTEGILECSIPLNT
ncbi:hypothetical protein L0F63_006232, partial [Massospora cicadina]